MFDLRATANPSAFEKVREMRPSLSKSFEDVMYNLNNSMFRPEESENLHGYPLWPNLGIETPPSCKE